MTRKEELQSVLNQYGDDIKTSELIDTVVDLEERMRYLRTLPFIRVSKKNPELQEVTPASRQYKELLQQYNNCLRTLFRIEADAKREEAKANALMEEESPLRKWARGRQE